MNDEKLTQANILIVDDHQENIHMLEEFLAIEGFTNYKSTRDPRMVMDLLSSFKPDLILLDLSMPHMTGFDVLDKLKATIPENIFLPVLVLTADISPKSKQNALSRGAHDFLTKPFHLVEVGLRIRNLLFTRSLQQQVLAQNKLLSKTVLERTIELQQTAKELTVTRQLAESSDRLKSEFVSLVNHEVRTPLNGLLGIALMLAEDENLSKTEKQEFIHHMSASGERLINTMDNVIDMSMITSGNVQVNLKPVKVVTGLQQLKGRFVERCLNKNVSMIVKIPDNIAEITITTDPNLLWKIMHHLLDNAIKFTAEGQVTLGFSLHKSLVEFYVTDTGIGIGKAAQERIFEPFTQEHGYANREYEGTGLGLSIIDGFLKFLNGKIGVESHKDIGSTFFFTIPLGEANIICKQ